MAVPAPGVCRAERGGARQRHGARARMGQRKCACRAHRLGVHRGEQGIRGPPGRRRGGRRRGLRRVRWALWPARFRVLQTKFRSVLCQGAWPARFMRRPGRTPPCCRASFALGPRPLLHTRERPGAGRAACSCWHLRPDKRLSLPLYAPLHALCASCKGAAQTCTPTARQARRGAPARRRGSED